MSRSLVLSNGSMAVCLDQWGQVKDLYYPHVGLENHVGEKLVHRMGVFVDGGMHWLGSGEFTVHMEYEYETLVSRIRAEHKGLGLVLHFRDVVYNEHAAFIRSVRMENTRSEARTVKLFFNQQFHISENKHADTAYYAPEEQAIVHYKGRRVFLVSAHTRSGFFDDYSIGLLGTEGREGTWRDAEDGVLSKCAIEHGTVDSVLGLTLELAAHGSEEVSYWVLASHTYRRVARLHRDIRTRGPDHLMRTTTDFWEAWVNRRELTTCGLEQDLTDLYKRSLLIMRAHTDNHGAIIASTDSSILQVGRDTYCYSWPRDAGYISLAFLRAGHTASAARLHAFWAEILTDEGYLLHKYRPDRSLGSSWHPWVFEGRAQPPIQEDETAITLLSLAAHYELTRDVESIEGLYNSYIRRAADFLTKYRDKGTGLPLISHDLWEEQLGTFTYTACTVAAALEAAAQFAKLLGKEVARARWASAASEVRDGILTQLIGADGIALKALRPGTLEREKDRTIDVSAFYGLFRYGILPLDDRRLTAMYERVKERLSVKTSVGGIARYEGDRYFRAADDVPGNPWILTTLWLAEFELARAQSAGDLTQPLERMRWVLRHASPTGLLPEQLHPHTGEYISAAPLTWSHAQYVITYHAYIDALTRLGLCKDVPAAEGKR